MENTVHTHTHKPFAYYFDLITKGVITVSFIIMGFMAQRLINQADRAQEKTIEEISQLNIKVAKLEAKIDILLSKEPRNVGTGPDVRSAKLEY